ncbi:helical backbone metal receptor [Dokdonia sp.]|uniref:ABC transporter substrate-binding protein n=1 Tax=Dokdonia sp. TaxID=2024995 RepID=UPI0032671D0E
MEYKDQLERVLQFSKVPIRIVSLVPSQTELLVDLGLRDHIVGLTKFCVHPVGLIKEKHVVGGTKQVHIDKVMAVKPDIILCNKEENTEQIVKDMEAIAPVHVSDIKNLEDSLSLIDMYGAIFDITNRTDILITNIQKKYHNFTTLIAEIPYKKVAYFIWKDPWMVAGNDTFITYLLDQCRFKNIFESMDGRYPEVQLEQLTNVDYVFLSSEPFPFAQKHMKEVASYTQAKVVLVDGEYFSWYGSRLLGAFDYFSDLRKELEL